MKKRILTIILSIVAVLACIFGLSACQRVKFKVNFVVDGTVYATIDTNGEEVIKMPENPTKDGYVFDGWYWDNDSWKKPFTANSLLNAPLSSDMNVYCKWKDNNDSNEDNIIFKTFTVEGANVYGVVSNDTKSFSFIDEITTNGNVKYIVSLDIYGLQTITSKTIPLSVGNNTAYVIELIDDEPQSTYTVTIRRRPMYSVTFATNGGSSIKRQTIEESFCATVPTETPTKTGYTFDGWDYDFTQPITQKTTITAK